MSDRKVVLKMVMSLDGFVTSPDGTHEWMFEWFGDDSGEWNRRALEEAGVHGGPDFAKSMTRLGLIDEYQLTTVPIAIGTGRSPFVEVEGHLKLDVVEEERFQSG